MHILKRVVKTNATLHVLQILVVVASIQIRPLRIEAGGAPREQ